MTQTPMPSAPPGSATPTCPSCQTALPGQAAPFVAQRCVGCGWKGLVYAYTPPPRVVDRAQQAMPDDVTCAHHPSKKAVHICAGTGSYICSLCAIQVEGQTYSAPFINEGGLSKAGKQAHVERTLPRPDHGLTLMLLLMIIPHCMALFPLWLGLAIQQFIKHRRMMRQDAVYARVTRPIQTLICFILVVAINGLILAGLLVVMLAALL